MQSFLLASVLLSQRGVRALRIALFLVVPAILGCVHTVSLEPIPQRDRTQAGDAIFLVQGSLAGGQDPLPLSGTDLSFEGVIHTLERYVASAADDWARRHRKDRPGGWELGMELVRSNAHTANGQVTAELDARFTLRGAAGRVYLAQTSSRCKQTETYSTGELAAAVVRACMEQMAREVGGWLEGISP